MSEGTQEFADFGQFLAKLTEEINKALNPDGNNTMGFACFIFNQSQVPMGVQVISNSERNIVSNVIKTFVARQEKLEDKKERRILRSVK